MEEIRYGSAAEACVSANAVMELLDSLEDGTTEPHGIMLMRHGIVFAQGWWNPYAKGLMHGMQSLSKTYTATAVGLTVQRGLLDLEERIADILSDKVENVVLQEEMKRVTVRHLLSMSSGMSDIPEVTGDWVSHFLRHPIQNEPGTAFFYNSVGSNLLGEIIRRKTGMGIQAYLEQELTEKLGMDSAHMKWMCLEDGLEIGGAGLFTTLENNLRLAKLYLNGGKWDGRQVLPEAFVQEAMTVQVENGGQGSVEGSAGYGYQMWKCSRRNVWRMDGAMGQYALICPDEDMVIVFTERLNEAVADAADQVLAKFWKFLDTGLERADDGQAEECLKKRLSALSLPAYGCQPFGKREAFAGSFGAVQGEFHLDQIFGGILSRCFPPEPIREFCVRFTEDELILEYKTGRGTQRLTAGMDGVSRFNRLTTPHFPVDKVCAGAFFDENRLILELRWIETCYFARVIFETTPDGLRINRIPDVLARHTDTKPQAVYRRI